MLGFTYLLGMFTSEARAAISIVDVLFDSIIYFALSYHL